MMSGLRVLRVRLPVSGRVTLLARRRPTPQGAGQRPGLADFDGDSDEMSKYARHGDRRRRDGHGAADSDARVRRLSTRRRRLGRSVMTLPRGGATCQCKFRLEPGLLLAVGLWRLSGILNCEPRPPGPGPLTREGAGRVSALCRVNRLLCTLFNNLKPQGRSSAVGCQWLCGS